MTVDATPTDRFPSSLCGNTCLCWTWAGGEAWHGGFIDGVKWAQTTLCPERRENWIGEDHFVRVVDLLVDQLDLAVLGFHRHAAARTGRPGYRPAVLPKLFIHGYLNRIPSSRRVEREAGRNVERMWLTGKLVPDHKTSGP